MFFLRSIQMIIPLKFLCFVILCIATALLCNFDVFFYFCVFAFLCSKVSITWKWSGKDCDNARSVALMSSAHTTLGLTCVHKTVNEKPAPTCPYTAPLRSRGRLWARRVPLPRQGCVVRGTKT